MDGHDVGIVHDGYVKDRQQFGRAEHIRPSLGQWRRKGSIFLTCDKLSATEAEAGGGDVEDEEAEPAVPLLPMPFTPSPEPFVLVGSAPLSWFE